MIAAGVAAQYGPDVPAVGIDVDVADGADLPAAGQLGPAVDEAIRIRQLRANRRRHKCHGRQCPDKTRCGPWPVARGLCCSDHSDASHRSPCGKSITFLVLQHAVHGMAAAASGAWDDGLMWPGAPVVLVMGLILAQSTQTRDCRQDPASSTPAPTPPPSTGTPPVDGFTTQDGVRIRVEVAATNLEVPWSMAFTPDGRLFVTERPGRVRILNFDSRTSELALTLDDTFGQGEAGALGLALDPDFGVSRLVYLYYTARAGGGAVNRLVRYREAGGRLGERVVLLDDVPASTIHDGGRIRFGPDGLLYVSTGDAATQSLSQSLGSLAGKILRLNRDGTSPRDNPFGSPVYTYGHRNPQGFDWHPATGQLWASEHGSTGNDEINTLRPGANYGWPIIQGAATMPGMEAPLAFFNPAVAPSGASFYRGRAVPQFENNLFVATLRGTHLLRLQLDGAGARIVAQERLLEERYGRIRDVVLGPDGLLYLCTNNRDGRGNPEPADDRILRLVPAS